MLQTVAAFRGIDCPRRHGNLEISERTPQVFVRPMDTPEVIVCPTGGIAIEPRVSSSDLSFLCDNAAKCRSKLLCDLRPSPAFQPNGHGVIGHEFSFTG